MEGLKKRKLEEEAGNGGTSDFESDKQLRLLLDPLRKDQLVDLLVKLGNQYPSVAEEIKGLASSDPVHCKLFVRGLSWETTTETLCALFSVHGEIEEGAVIVDKATGRSRGYGFITYKHMESTQRALQEPSKLIDGRLAVCNLACEGLSNTSVSSDLVLRKIYIGGLSPEISSQMLLNFFGRYGEIEEGSVAYDKETNKSRGFGFVTYKTVDAAKKAIDDPNKTLGKEHYCKACRFPQEQSCTNTSSSSSSSCNGPYNHTSSTGICADWKDTGQKPSYCWLCFLPNSSSISHCLYKCCISVHNCIAGFLSTVWKEGTSCSACSSI